MTRTIPTAHPWREGNRFRLLPAVDAFLDAMQQAIESARAEIRLEMYLVESGQVTERFIGALCGAAERGVAVRMLLDDFGARNLKASDRSRLRQAGIELAFYNPLASDKWRLNLRRDHRKLLLIDRERGYTGGAGLSDQLLSRDASRRGWRETMLEMQGPVLGDWAAIFDHTWRKYSEVKPADSALPPPTRAGTMRGRVVQSRGAHRPAILRSFLQRIRSATTRVWISTPYFIPSHRLRRGLMIAARRGCDVRVLVPGRFIDHPGVRYASRRYYGRLLHAGVRVFEYRPRFLHTKVLLCDGWGSLGSSNLDTWNQFWNLDANQEIEDPDFAREIAEMLNEDFSNAREITALRWRRRPWHRRLLERWWGAVESWLFRLFGRGLPRKRHRRRRSEERNRH